MKTSLSSIAITLLLSSVPVIAQEPAGLSRSAVEILNRLDQLESEIRQRTILESVVDSLITIDERGIIESANPATETMFGYSIDEMLGNNVSMLMPEPYHSEHHGYLKQYLEDGKTYVLGIARELVARRRDNSTFPIELSVSEMSIGDEKKFTGLIKDISDRKHAENELLKESQALTRLNEVAAIYPITPSSPMATRSRSAHARWAATTRAGWNTRTAVVTGRRWSVGRPTASAPERFGGSMGVVVERSERPSPPRRAAFKPSPP